MHHQQNLPRKGRISPVRFTSERSLGLLCGTRGKGERSPDIPPLRPIFRAEFKVSFEIDESGCLFTNIEVVANLRADTENTRFEVTERRTIPAIARNLLIGIPATPT